jgi:superfamily II RNA helicase
MSNEISVEIKNNKYDGIHEFKNAPFELSDFQKWAIDGYLNKKNVLITAHTGSGKTYPAEYAIEHSVLNGYKIIYTSPIKSLSNQKFYDFQKKFPFASVGILTGDIKYNPEGNVLIMTTEILRNLVLFKKIKDSKTGLDIHLDIETEINCVIFDEVHYINDKDRGHVWEESIMMLPKHIQLIMLSATIDNPKWFCEWIRDLKQRSIVWTSTDYRVVPLRHSLFISYLPSYLNNKKLPNDIRSTAIDMNCKMTVFSDNTNKFNCQLYDKWSTDLKRTVAGVSTNTIIQDCINYLWNEDLYPAIFFTFSRIRCEQLAKSVSQNLLLKDEMAEVIRITNYYIGKSHNRTIYENLPQWLALKQALYKGVAFHHSGLVPLFKEIIEMLYAKNLIKVLFATETFAVGVNMPTRTVVFTSLEKMTNGTVRYLETSEYLQMAGRAGRRGIDTLGTIIILPYGSPKDIVSIPPNQITRNMICGSPQRLTSKFAPDYQFILKMILTDISIDNLVEKSLYHRELLHEKGELENEMSHLIQYKDSELDFTICREYDKCIVTNNNGIQLTQTAIKNNKKRATEIREKDGFNDLWSKYKEWKQYKDQYDILLQKMNHTLNHTKHQIENVLKVLEKYGYVTKSELPLTKEHITKKGIIASSINECNCILLTELLCHKQTDNLDESELAAILAIFSDSEPIDKSLLELDDENIPEDLWILIEHLDKVANEWENEQVYNKLNINMEWKLNRYLIGAVYRWMKKDSIKNIIDYYNVFEGNFIKDMLRVYNLASDVKDSAKVLEKNAVSVTASKIVSNILRDIINVESIYVQTS